MNEEHEQEFGMLDTPASQQDMDWALQIIAYALVAVGALATWVIWEIVKWNT